MSKFLFFNWYKAINELSSFFESILFISEESLFSFKFKIDNSDFPFLLKTETSQT